MIKKYTKPELNILVLEPVDVIQTSNITTTDLPKSMSADAQQLKDMTIDVFGE